MYEIKNNGNSELKKYYFAPDNMSRAKNNDYKQQMDVGWRG